MGSMTREQERGIHAIPPMRVLTDEVYDAVLALLMGGDIPPGERASIDALSRELQVSATPIREALVRLEAEGLVVKTPRKGYMAAELLDAHGLANLFEMRLLLEPTAATRASGRLSGEQLAQLEASVEEMTRAASSNGGDRFEDYRAFADADAYFHSCISEASGNPLLTDAIGRLRAHTHLYRLYYSHELAAQTSGEHGAVLAALRAGDATAAGAAMHNHISHSRSRIASYLEISDTSELAADRNG
ncbi:MAG: hypothetical protein JWM49_1804 [Microbacteriaceae bacterium]|jgi:DNA-binding GntR family transcriptional regulator|nr:hypothetical protein [Microbacteriaceae bacterium]